MPRVMGIRWVQLDKELFDCSLKIKSLLFPSGRSFDSTPPSLDGKGVKLPKLDVPLFDGNIVNWRTFWEQFSISIQSQPDSSDAEKLVYLPHSLKMVHRRVSLKVCLNLVIATLKPSKA